MEKDELLALQEMDCIFAVATNNQITNEKLPSACQDLTALFPRLKEVLSNPDNVGKHEDGTFSCSLTVHYFDMNRIRVTSPAGRTHGDREHAYSLTAEDKGRQALGILKAFRKRFVGKDKKYKDYDEDGGFIF